jgi:omega-6 fatty acid desaturase (delta-12 desaturase)
VTLWALAWWSVEMSYAAAAAFSVLNAEFLVRLFAIQHHLGRAPLFRSHTASDWIGRAIGVITS